MLQWNNQECVVNSLYFRSRTSLVLNICFNFCSISSNQTNTFPSISKAASSSPPRLVSYIGKNLHCVVLRRGVLGDPYVCTDFIGLYGSSSSSRGRRSVVEGNELETQREMGELGSARKVLNCLKQCHMNLAGNPQDRTSTKDYVVYLGNSPVSWSSKKQKSVSHSFMEAEYRAIAAAVSEVDWLTNLLPELHLSLSEAVLDTIACNAEFIDDSNRRFSF